MRKLFLAIFVCILSLYAQNANSQSLIASQDFEATPQTPTLTYSNTNGALITGSSASTDRPASSTFYSGGAQAWQVTNASGKLRFDNFSGLGTYTNKYLKLRLAAWSIGSTGNGMDGTDSISILISLDGGTTWSRELVVNGNSNAYWHYSTGTGNASTTYDGDNTATIFTPGGGGARTTDGYSTMQINLPNSCTQVKMFVSFINNATAERWTIDDVQLWGTLSSTNDQLSDIISNTSFSPGSNISYLNYTGTDLTLSNSIELGQFIIRDGGGAADGDIVSTILTALNFSVTNGANLERIALYDGSTELAEIAGGATASFTGLNIIAPDGSTKTFSLRANFKTTVTDNQQISAKITSATASNSGSGFAASDAGGAETSTSGDNNRIEVIATQLNFVQNTTSPTGVNVAMAPAPTVSANDVNSNRDLDFTGAIQITSTGTLQGTPVSVNAVNGLATFSSLTHTATGNALQLTAASTGLSNVLSSLFDIILASNQTDYFRTRASGAWSDILVWESSGNGTDWVNATIAPNHISSGITILNGHNVNANSKVSLDQTVVNTGGTLTLTSDSLIINDNIAGDDLVINGTLINIGSIIKMNTGATVKFNSGGLYQHNRNGGAIIPATWDVNSTCELTGLTSLVPSGLGQVFGNFTVNSTSMNTNLNLTGSLTTVNGNFWIQNTGTTSIRMIANSPSTSVLDVGKDLIINDDFNMSSGSASVTINVKGNVIATMAIDESGTGTDNKIVMNGLTSQTIDAPSGFTNDVSLVIDNAAGVQLVNNTLSKRLTLTNGLLSLGGYNFTMTINYVLTGGSQSSHIVTNSSGRLILNTNASGVAYTFPVGNTTNVQPAVITFDAAPGAGTLSGAFISGKPTTLGLPVTENTDNINSTSVAGIWEITSALTGNYTAEFTGNNFSDIIDYSKLHLLKRADASSNWTLNGTHVSPSGSNSSATVSRTGVSGFSQFAFGGEYSVALPIKLLSFSANSVSNGNLLKWSTSDEVNNYGFEIENSEDGVNYTRLGFVPAKPIISTRSINNYQFMDAKFYSGNIYYRLKQLDNNGSFSYSKSILISQLDKSITLYPTRAENELHIDGLTKESDFQIIDMLGNTIQKGKLKAGTNILNVNYLLPGNYVFQLLDYSSYSSKFVKQ